LPLSLATRPFLNFDYLCIPRDLSSSITSSLSSSLSSSSSKSRPYKFKVVLLGDSGVGKTCIAQCFAGTPWSDGRAAPQPTIAAAYSTCTIRVDDRRVVQLEVWDTAGQERFRSLTPMYYRGAKAAFVVYSITERSSFLGAKRWVEELRQSAARDIVVVLLGNKCDARSYDNNALCVPADLAMAYADAEGLSFLEVSARVGLNIEEALRAVCTGKSHAASASLSSHQQLPTDAGLHSSLESQACGAPGSPLKLASAAASVDILHRLCRCEATLVYRNESDLPWEAAFAHRLDPCAVLTSVRVSFADRRLSSSVLDAPFVRSLSHQQSLSSTSPAFLVSLAPQDGVLRTSLGVFPARQTVAITFVYLRYLPAHQHRDLTTLSFRLFDPAFDEASRIRIRIHSPAPLSSVESSLPISFSASSTSKGSISSFIYQIKNNRIEKLHLHPRSRSRSMLHETAANSDASSTDPFQPFQLWMHLVSESPLYSISETDAKLQTNLVFTSGFRAISPSPQPRGVVFLVDMNSSIVPTVWLSIRRALHVSIHSLPPGCAFNVVGFGSSTQKVFDELTPLTPESLLTSCEAIQKWNADLGGVDLFSALEALLKSLPPKPTSVVVMLDGQPSNVADLLQLISSSSPSHSISALGTSSSASVGVIRSISISGRGAARYALDQDTLISGLLALLKLSILAHPPLAAEDLSVALHPKKSSPKAPLVEAGLSGYLMSFVEDFELVPDVALFHKRELAKFDQSSWIHQFAIFSMISDLSGQRSSQDAERHNATPVTPQAVERICKLAKEVCQHKNKISINHFQKSTNFFLVVVPNLFFFISLEYLHVLLHISY
ncbi:MAG: GTP-binding protein, partial [archaeon]|nr:GTP-binding protein [archaeon]